MLRSISIAHPSAISKRVLIEQLDAITHGTKDIYWVLGEKPVDQLSDDEKRFIFIRFFDANWQHIISRFPRYKELLTKLGSNADLDSIDASLPAGVEPTQEAGLSDYTPSQEDFSTLPPEAFGKLPMVTAK